MPMQLTISRNRKQSENYNSQGYGVSLTIELDQSLLTRPGDLQHAIDELYQEADSALERQASGADDNGTTQRQREPASNGRGSYRNHRADGSRQQLIPGRQHFPNRLGLWIFREFLGRGNFWGDDAVAAACDSCNLSVVGC